MLNPTQTPLAGTMGASHRAKNSSVAAAASAVTVWVALAVAAPALAQCDPMWTLRTVSGPAAREGAMMTFDPASGQVILFGGGNHATGVRFNDTWEWDGITWTQRSPIGPLPAPRFAGAAAFDSSRGRMVIFGGNAINNSQNFGDTWEWDGTSWAQVAIANGPAQRTSHAMAYDTVRNVSVMVGGQSGANPAYRETWHWNGAAWSRPSAAGPSGRYGPGLAFDTLRTRSVFFGGTSTFGNSQVFGDTWEWNGSAWTSTNPTLAPPARRFHAMAFDPTRAATFVFGGDSTNGVFRSDTWMWSGSAWTQAVITGPSARRLPTMVYDGARGELVLFGGFDTSVRGDTWVLPSALGVIRPPAPIIACPSNDVTFAIHAVGIGSLSYQWRKDAAPIDSSDNPSAATTSLVLTNVQSADAAAYDCIVTNACGSVTSDAATLTICIGDFNCDGGVDGADVEAFFADWESGNARADVNEDGGIDGGDVEYFFGHWETGC